jgi:hypothetical protein
MEAFRNEPKDIQECPVCKKIVPGFILHEDEIWRCPHCDSQAREFTIIQVTLDLNLDEGCSPEVESACEDIELLAEKQSLWFDSETGLMINASEIYAVPVQFMVDTLDQICPEAAQWCLENFPDIDGYVVFQRDAVEEISPLTIVVSTREMREFEGC